MLVDVAPLDVHFRGFPVGYVGQPVVERFPEFVIGPHALLEVLGRMSDLADVDEPDGWMFEAVYGNRRLWLARNGGYMDDGHHVDGFWTLCFPEDR